MFNIVIALRIWGRFWKHSQVDIHCDNMAVVQVDKWLHVFATFGSFPPLLTLLFTIYRAQKMSLLIVFQGCIHVIMLTHL